MKKLQGVVSDLDHTLLRSDQSVSPEDLAAIAALRAKNIPVVLATGRHVRIELIGQPGDGDTLGQAMIGERRLEPRLADEAPGAGEIGDDRGTLRHRMGAEIGNAIGAFLPLQLRHGL